MFACTGADRGTCAHVCVEVEDSRGAALQERFLNLFFAWVLGTEFPMLAASSDTGIFPSPKLLISLSQIHSGIRIPF